MMQGNVGNYLKNAKDSRRTDRKLFFLLIACGILIAVGVMWALILPGVGQDGDPTCGLEEHTHDETCTVTGYACELEEHDHVVSGCALNCEEEHDHTDACYDCGTAAHTHSEACGMVYSCGKTEHTHDESCYASTNTDTSEDTSTVNESLVIGMVANQTDGKGLAGQTLSVKVVSQYSKANDTGKKVTAAIKIGELPQGVTLEGFDENGEQTVILQGAEGDTEQEITLKIEYDESSKEAYIVFEQPQGSTLEFNIQFNSKNGIMADNSTVKLEVAEDKITGIEESTKVSVGEGFFDSVDLTWTADNEWDPVEKKVNGVDWNEIAVKASNTLSGTLTYTIQANSSNNETVGEIWTDHIDVTDTLTLPTNISLPADAKINDAGNAIVDGSGNVILSFVDVPAGTSVSLALSDDRKAITYTLSVPNNNKDENGVLKGEMENLSLKMELNAELLVLAENYVESDAFGSEYIKNHVTIQPVPCQPYSVPESSDEVGTKPVKPAETFSLNKTADKTTVQAGETINYTITLENTGETSIVVKDDSGNYYTVTDTLPESLYLTTEQIAALKASAQVDYDEATRTISWIPSETKIAAKETCTLSFAATVKEDAKLNNGGKIYNKANYKWTDSNTTEVTFEKASLNIEKSGSRWQVGNGEEITYTIKVTNQGNVAATVPETVTDALPEGLEFVSTTIGTTELKSSGECTLHTSEEECGQEHKVTFNVDGQNLSWDIGTLGASEVVTFTYVCKVNTDKMSSDANSSKDHIINKATLGTGSESSKWVGVNYPIKLDKEVDKDTSRAYESGTVFEYTLTVENDAQHPSEKDDLVLVDQLPKGILPYPNGDDCVLKNSAGEVVEWSEFVSDDFNADADSFTTTVGNWKATVEKVDGAVKLSWNIGKMDAGETISISYKAQMTLTDDQIAADTTYQFTNTASIDGISDSVTVKGGKEYGDLTIEKYFLSATNIYNWVRRVPDEEELKKLEFTLTGVDKDGQTIVFADGSEKLTLTWDDFSVETSSGNWYKGTSKLENLPAGTYTMTEKEYNNDGYIITPIMKYSGGQTSGWTASFAVNEGDNKLEIEDNEYSANVVNLQKSVYEIAKESADGTWTSLPEKYLFSNDDEDTTLVVYNITLSAAGESGVEIESFVDKLPDGVKFIGICKQYDYDKNRSSFTNNEYGIWTSTDGMLNNAYELESALSSGMFYAEAGIVPSYNESTNEVTFTLKAYNNEAGTHISKLQAGMIVSFLMLCEVDNSVVAGQQLTNTVEIVVPDETILSEVGEYQTTNTPYDRNQNNGDAVVVKEADGKKTIASSVTIVPENSIVPGVEKNAISYILPGQDESQSIELQDDSNIQSNAAVKWEIIVYNDGTQDMVDYQVQDTVTSPFHLMTKAEAEKFGITTPYSYQIYQYDSSQKTCALKGEYDLSEEVWNTVTTAETSSYSFDFSDEKYTIPAGGYAILTIYTNNTKQSNRIYRNTATVLPSQEFVANKVSQGELKKGSNGEYIGVTAGDEVYALGEYASVSWKTIEEKEDSTNTARGTQSKNYISVGLDSKEVTYTNNIRNISTNVFTKFVMIDLMPMKNDTGVVNQNDIRGSEFSVFYNGGLKLTVVDKEGNVTPVDSSEYRIQFSSETAFTEKDFAGVDSNRWHDEWKTGDCSFRIIMGDDFVLNPQETLVVQYDGKIEDSAVPGAIAWNSFGYQYHSGSDSAVQLRAEPPKVGVMIPPVSLIQKEVIDSDDKLLERNADIQFLFVLSERNTDENGNTTDTKLCEFTLCQGGYCELKDLVDTEGNPIVLENGKEYVVMEVTDQMPDGYEFVGIGKNGGTLSKDAFSFVYYDTKEISILVKNKVENYRPELPSTGGVGTSGFKAAGVVLMLLAVLSYGHTLKNQRKKETMK